MDHEIKSQGIENQYFAIFLFQFCTTFAPLIQIFYISGHSAGGDFGAICRKIPIRWKAYRKAVLFLDLFFRHSIGRWDHPSGMVDILMDYQ